MPTVEEYIRVFPRPVRANYPDLQIVRNLFRNFCDLASSRWKYAAGNSSGFSTLGVLTGDWTQPHSFNCGTLLNTFMKALERYYATVLGRSYGELGISQEDSTLWFPFVSDDQYGCFDGDVVGNVRKTTQSVAQVRRCLFSSHFFIKIGGRYYDPTFCTTYANADDIVWRKMGGDRVEYHQRSRWKRFTRARKTFGLAPEKNAYYLSEDGEYAFVMTGEKSHGFSETFCMYDVNDLTDQQKKRMGIR